MAARAVMSWLKQTYNPAKRWLYVMDSGSGIGAIDALPDAPHDFNIRYHRTQPGLTIGALRNYANGWQADIMPDVFAHWDDDDYSHPNRLAEQVALLQSSGADCVGYDEMLFWDTRRATASPRDYEVGIGDGGKAWLFSQQQAGKYTVALGTSLMYWRRTWEHKPFRNTSSGEDLYFVSGLKTVAVTSVEREETAVSGCACHGSTPCLDRAARFQPRMIASIHARNTASRIDPQAKEWTRVPNFDAYCREQMTYEPVFLPKTEREVVPGR